MESSFRWPVIHSRRFIYLRDLLSELLIREMRLRYERSALGLVWSIINPLSQMLIYTFLFRVVFRLDIKNYPAFVFTGTLVWNWFHNGLEMTTNAITNNRELIRQPGFPLAVLPVSTVIIPLVDLLAALPVLFLFLIIGSKWPTSAVLVLPVLVVIQFIMTLGLGYILASSNVIFRDTQHLLRVFLNLLFFLTPIFYDSSMVPQSLQFFYRMNPMVHLVNAYRMILLEGTVPDWRPLLILCLFFSGVTWLGWTIFIRASHRFVEEL